MGSKTQARARRAGFTLVEMIIVMTIIAVLAGVALPAVGAAVDRAARDATRDEMRGVEEAVRGYFLDTLALPANANALMLDPGVAGWSGPYLTGGIQTAGAAANEFDLDGWQVPYQLTIAGDLWTLRSAGADRAQGTNDDIVMAVDVTRERRQLTTDRLEVINQAIRLYNDDWLSPPPPQAPDPLSSSWPSALGQLVTRGYLPNATEYATDGWGDDFVRIGASGPVVQVRSVNVGS